MKFIYFWIRLAALLAIAPVSFSLAGQAAGVIHGFNLLTPQQEIEIGRQSSISVEKRLPLISDAKLNEYINRLGQALVSRDSYPSYPYSFKIANLSEVNAFAFPGGPIYITCGAIEAARDEGELAGVLAHEIAHVGLRHGSNQASRAYLAHAGLGALGGFAGEDAATNIISAIGGPGFNEVLLKYSQEAEVEANDFAARIMASAGYDPGEMEAFFHALGRGERVEATQLRNFLDEHPKVRTDGQLKRVFGRTSSPHSNDDFHQIQTRIAELPRAGASAELGTRSIPAVIEEASSSPQILKVERPSSRARDYWLCGAKFQLPYPENWKAYPSGDELGVAFIPSGAVVGNRGFQRLIYGAVINRYAPVGDNNLWTGLRRRSFRYIGGRGELVEATNDILDSALQNNPYLDFARGSDRRGSISGAGIITFMLVGRSSGTGRAERAQLYTRELEDGEIIYAIFVAPDDDYDNFRPVFDRLLRGLKINDKELRRVE